jgi:hypothetical protein
VVIGADGKWSAGGRKPTDRKLLPLSIRTGDARQLAGSFTTANEATRQRGFLARQMVLDVIDVRVANGSGPLDDEFQGRANSCRSGSEPFCASAFPDVFELWSPSVFISVSAFNKVFDTGKLHNEFPRRLNA